MMEKTEAIKRLNFLIERGQEKNNEAIKLAMQSLRNDCVTCKDCYYLGNMTCGKNTDRETTIPWCKQHGRQVNSEADYCTWFEDKGAWV